MKKLLIYWLILTASLAAQSFSVNKIEPPNWWAGMKLDTLQLMVYGNDLSNVKVKSGDESFVILRTHYADSPNYLFIDIDTKNLLPGNYKLEFYGKGETKTIEYEILGREQLPNTHRGFGVDDVIYLIFVDRFADGDLQNDKIPNKYEEFKPGSLNGRAGGDLQGIINHLDYLKNLGVTAIWHTPVLQNNMYMSYHGYAATDLYNVDRRFGSNGLYKQFVNAAHDNGIKVIMDHVNNHIGVNHAWVKDAPFADWFHGTVDKHPKAYHNKIAFFDVHGDSLTPKRSETGWFTDYMPDLNKSNRFVANYMIQNTLWWIEFAGIDGIREDTYPYNNLKYMERWAKIIFENYPQFNIVGEVWKGDPAFLSMYQKDSRNSYFNSHLSSITDFAFSEAIRNYLAGNGDLHKFYETLAKDFLYGNPYMLMTFIDNHDVDRAMFIAENNLDKYKVALTLLLTSRGIPQLTYGTELGMNGGGHHGRIRAKFPGGFPDDDRNAFDENERTETENKIFNYVKLLLKLRREHSALRNGKLIHLPPHDDVYAYVRVNKEEKVLIVVNYSGNESVINTSSLKPLTKDANQLIELNGSENILNTVTGKLKLEKYQTKIFEVR